MYIHIYTCILYIYMCVYIYIYTHIHTYIYKFILAALGLSDSMWDLGGIEPGPPALRAQSLSHWTTREVSRFPFLVPLFIKRLNSEE